MNDRKRPVILTILIFLVCSIIFLIILEQGTDAQNNQLIGTIGLVIVGWCIVSSKMMYGKFFSLILMFELSFYILTAGQSFLYALGIPLDTTLDLYWSDPAEIVNKAYIYTFFCIMLFHLGTMIKRNGKIKLVIGHRHYSGLLGDGTNPDYTYVLRNLGWMVFAISIIPYTYQEFNLLRSYIALGYKASYMTISGLTSWSKIFSMIGDYFIFSLFMLLAGYKDSKQMRYLPAIFIALISFLNFAVGNRSEPICYMIALLWFFKNYAKTKGGQKFTTAMMVVGIGILFLIIPIIGQTRNNGTLSFETITNALYGKDSAFNAIKDTFITMGWTGFPMVKTMVLIPDSYPFRYGQSYFFALLALIPNLLGGIHISVKYAGLPQWLKTALSMSYGPGYSMPAEAYYNFGWFGIALMLLFGKWVSALLSENQDIDDSLKLFTKLGLFIVLFSIPRREMMTALRDGVYFVGFLYLGVKVLYKYRRKNH